jgi:hypothetical protein
MINFANTFTENKMSERIRDTSLEEKAVPDEERLEDEYGLEANDDVDSLSIYPNAEVRVEKVQFSVLHLKRLYEDRKELILNPDFQRKDVWKRKQRSELIESILMGIPIPIMYLFETADGRKQVVDGRQRITTIIDYLNNEFSLRDLKILHDLNGSRFRDLDKKLQGIFEDYQLHVYVIQPPTPERVKYDIFDRVNRGGTRLNNQEMRNALYGGKATKLLKDLSESEPFLEATERGVSPARMKDQYIILRTLAFLLWRNGDLQEIRGMEAIEYKSDIDDFLAKVMIAMNGYLEDEVIEDVRSTFLLAMERIHRVLGKDAFRFEPKESGTRRPINMLLFETLTYLFTFEEADNKMVRPLINEWKKKIDKTGGAFRESVDASSNVNARFENVEEVRELIRMLE